MSLLDKLNLAPAPPKPKKFSLLARLGSTSIAVPADQIISAPIARHGIYGVQNSQDLKRIVELPARGIPSQEDLAPLVEIYSSRLRKPISSCNCKSKFNRKCITHLNTSQAWGLHELIDPKDRYGKAVGLFAPLSVGEGKTLLWLLCPMVVPDCKRAVLFIPANLRAQLLKVDWDYYGQHWTLPNLAGGRFFTPGKPVLHVVAYSELSHEKSTDPSREATA